MRTKPTPNLITRTQIDTHLQRFAILQGECEIVRADADRKIAAARAEMDAYLAPLLIEMDRISDEITHHLSCYKADFVVNREIKFRFGRIGWRKIRSDALSIKTKLRASIIETLERLNMFDCLKIEKKIDARSLAKYSDAVLAQIDGVTRPPESEEPWFEAYREPIIGGNNDPN